MTSALFQPLKIGKNTLQTRLVLAPLTRQRASDEHVPLPFVAEYYAQRASSPGTLLITEATFIGPQASGLNNVPGIWNAAQIEAWSHVTNAVHGQGSFIFMQLWALGRAAAGKHLRNTAGRDAEVKSSGDIPINGLTAPTPLTEAEITEYIGLYAQAARNAIAAGFDGVEIHAANGYLIDQFIQDTSNNRADRWGGSIENRARFAVEVSRAVVDAVGAERTGIRLSPFSTFQNMKMAEPVPQFTYLAGEIKELRLAYLHVVEASVAGGEDSKTPASESVDFLLDTWGKTSPVLLAGGFTPATAYQSVDEKHAGKDVAIVFGRYFISNPDLVFRVREGIELEPYDRSKFYLAKQEEGYTTYPYSPEFDRQSASTRL
ncbi:hypothetical protein BJ875DRAFT_461783 [Amylocarpus encephaloides]|uniref:NADH:flavin oxidoreductase/NADH oxidase N-terminal domain-containing protein n=1 Tax=Amylocarpus encephaloides TaxID=45428 RepID=A0A9P8C5M7_9HELO|nr:hypothetical protein BJ875DRAFT_461783 [Amylocarpus encephaloides]